MTPEQMDYDLETARDFLGCTRLTADRCRHENNTETAIWIFDGKTQIGAVSREGEKWRVSSMYRSMPTSEIRLPGTATGLSAALAHIMERTKATERAMGHA